MTSCPVPCGSLSAGFESGTDYHRLLPLHAECRLPSLKACEEAAEPDKLQNGAWRHRDGFLGFWPMNKPESGGRARTEAILSWLRRREDEMAALLAELVAIPTENPPGRNYGLCAAVLEKRLKDLGLDCERYSPPVPNT